VQDHREEEGAAGADGHAPRLDPEAVPGNA